MKLFQDITSKNGEVESYNSYKNRTTLNDPNPERGLFYFESLNLDCDCFIQTK